MDLQKQFIEKVNAILEHVDFAKLMQSANGQDLSYAQDTLKQLHQAFVDTYSTDCITNRALGFIEVPAIIRGRNRGEIFVGLVTVDLEGSGEHWNSVFFMENGVVDQAATDNWDADFFHRVGVYDYWYTPEIPCDIHVNFEQIPHQVEALLRSSNGITPTQEAVSGNEESWENDFAQGMGGM